MLAMPVPRGKRIALLAGAVAVLALVAPGVAAKDRLREQWYLWQLSSRDADVRQQAIDVLADMKSVRAVPGLIRWLALSDSWPIVQNVSQEGQRARFAMDPASHALFRIGPIALP